MPTFDWRILVYNVWGFGTEPLRYNQSKDTANYEYTPPGFEGKEIETIQLAWKNLFSIASECVNEEFPSMDSRMKEQFIEAILRYLMSKLSIQVLDGKIRTLLFIESNTGRFEIEGDQVKHYHGDNESSDMREELKKILKFIIRTARDAFSSTKPESLSVKASTAVLYTLLQQISIVYKPNNK